MELATAIRPYIPNSLACAGLVRRALNDVFRRQHAMTLDVLSALGRREARQYLESLDGVDGYVAASVMLWSLGGHAIPVDSRMFESLRQEVLIDPSATIAEVQAFSVEELQGPIRELMLGTGARLLEYRVFLTDKVIELINENIRD